MSNSFLGEFQKKKTFLIEDLGKKGINSQLADELMKKLEDFLAGKSTELSLNKLANTLNSMKDEGRLSKCILVYMLFFIALNLESLVGYQYPHITPFEGILLIFVEDASKREKIRDSLSPKQKNNIERAYSLIVNNDVQKVHKVTRFGDWARVFLTFCGNEICVCQNGSGITIYFSFWCTIFRAHFKIPLYPRLSRSLSSDAFKGLVGDEKFMTQMAILAITHGDMSISKFLSDHGKSKGVDSTGDEDGEDVKCGGGGGGGGGESSSTGKRSREEIEDASILLKLAKTPSSSLEEDDDEKYVIIFDPNPSKSPSKR